MSALLTKNFKILMAEQVYNLLDLGANAYLPAAKKSYLYAFFGRHLPWNSGTEVEGSPSQTDSAINDYYKRGVLAKQISLENASLVIPRNDWTSNTVYNTYEANTNFYVINSKDQVFKCLSNVSTGTVSTVSPELTLSTTSLEEPYVETSDFYKWKYMYTLTSIQKQKFLTDDWMPVSVNKFVRAAAEPGSIDIVTVTNSGNNYTVGTVQNIITIDGDGTGAVLKANVSGGKVQNIVIQNRGNYYTYSNLTFTDVSGGIGTLAAAQVSIAPHNGHGYEPTYELGGSTIMFNVEFDEDEGGVLPVDNDFREVVILRNPYLYNATTLATGQKYSLYTLVKVSPGVGDFNNDEVVYQGTTYASATFTADVISFSETPNLLYLNNVRGTLQTNQAIRGLQTGAIRIVNTVTNPTLDLYSGKILYISDKLPITRDPAQTERIRFILSF
jgi:hypothetical protein